MKKVAIALTFTTCLILASSGINAQASGSTESFSCGDPNLISVSGSSQVEIESSCVGDTGTFAASYAVSGNWAGAIMKSSNRTYSTAVGRISIPSRSTSSCLGSAYTGWVGIGGVSTTNKLMQAGFIYAKGSSYPRAFYEYITPNLELPVQYVNSVPLHPGDDVEFKVIFDRSNSQAEFVITNLSTADHVSITTQLLNSDWDGTTAEWIDERPLQKTATGTRYLPPLANFGTADWYGSKAVMSDGAWHSIASEPYELDYMADGNTILASPDNGLTNSMSFTDYYHACSAG